MILTALLTAGAIVVGAGIIATFWNEILGWLHRILDKLKTMIQGTIEGFKIFFSKMEGTGKQIAKNYAKVGTKWKETIVEKTVELSDIPEEYRQKMLISNTEYEYTEELERQLAQ